MLLAGTGILRSKRTEQSNWHRSLRDSAIETVHAVHDGEAHLSIATPAEVVGPLSSSHKLTSRLAYDSSERLHYILY